MTRKLATIRQISEIKEHTNADSLELAVIDGWTVVVKKGEYAAGAIVLYLEIDSWVTSSLAPFLTKPGKEPKEYMGVKGERLRTIKLRGVISQGLVLPMSVLPGERCYAVGEDLSELLNIEKWEHPLPACLVGMAKGLFPSFIRKTDQERIQNVFHTLTQEQIEDVYEVTLKLDGSSATYFVKDGDVGVCSRNLELKLEGNEENSFVKMFNQLELPIKLLGFYERTGRSIALQGELWGSAINGNHEGISDHRYNVFDIFDIDKQTYMSPLEVSEITQELGLSTVPRICFTSLKDFHSVSDFLEMADRGSIHNKVAEGIVFVSTINPDFSFKAINNNYLMGGGD